MAAHTYTNHLYHGVYSTKERRPWIEPGIVTRLTEITGGIISKRGGSLLAFNAMPNHVHLLALFPHTVYIPDMYRDIKAISSGWLKETFPRMRGFAWQSGYSSFTVGMTTLERVKTYVQIQQEHHRTKTFEEEILRLLDESGVKYDPRYVLD